MTSKEALHYLYFLSAGDENKTIKCRQIIRKDLDRLEKLEKENKELKEKVNRFEKIIEGIKNLPNLDCSHMFINCKKLTPLPKIPELEKYNKNAKKHHKDLEILEEFEILKNYYEPFKQFLKDMFEKGHNEDLTKVKEWLDE